MRFNLLNLSMLGSFLVLLVAKVFELGIGASVPWIMVFSPLWGLPLSIFVFFIILCAVAALLGLSGDFVKWIERKARKS